MTGLHVLVTGASGFVGNAVCANLESQGYMVRSAVRSARRAEGLFGDVTSVGEIDAKTDWSCAVRGVNVVVHTAARVHIMDDTAVDPLTEFRRVNVAGTLNLARQAVEAGVRRLVFISSIGVNGAETFDMPFTDKDLAAPHSPYAVSKYEAELGLQQISQDHDIEIVIIRPPLVFGPNAPGNFNKLLKIMNKGFPLPLGAIHNQRSFVALDNLVDLIVTCVYHPAATNQTFLVSDGDDLSTTSLLKRTAVALGQPARLIPVPMQVVRVAARLLGRINLAQQLCGSLQVDISKARIILGWTPPVSVDEALKKTAEDFLARQQY